MKEKKQGGRPRKYKKPTRVGYIMEEKYKLMVGVMAMHFNQPASTIASICIAQYSKQLILPNGQSVYDAVESGKPYAPYDHPDYKGLL